MLLSLNVLKNYLTPSNEAIDAQVIADKLTSFGLETFVAEDTAKSIKDVVIAQVIECEKHPDADKLSVTKIDTGSEIYNVVCGAANIKKGLKIAFAPLNAVLPGDFKIKKIKIRGVESSGMCCAASELGLVGDNDGIIELPQDAPVGNNFANEYGHGDTLLEVDLTPDRSDCLSYLGIAIEAAAILKREVKRPVINPVKKEVAAISDYISIENNAPKLCPRYMAKVVMNVEIKESPQWLKEILEKNKVKSINNIVDITNLILLETGQPLHAFDLSKINAAKIEIKPATNGDKFLAIDGKEYQLTSEDLCINDGNSTVALAGVIGGLDSGIDAKTKNILIECANFNAATVRRSSQRHDISTDSSIRFSKGRDIFSMDMVIKRTLSLIQELAGGDVAQGLIDINHSTRERVEITLNKSFVEKTLGLEISIDTIINLLSSVEIECVKLDDENAKVTPPTLRLDLIKPIDFVEEILRLHGLDKVPLVDLKAPYIAKAASESTFLKIYDLKKNLSQNGFHETINYSFVAPEDIKKFGLEDYASDKPAKNKRAFYNFARLLELSNPLSVNMSIMRPSVLPSLYNSVLVNTSHQCEEIRLFEISKVFGNLQLDSLEPTENTHLGLITHGKQYPLSQFNEASLDADFFELKETAENILASLKLGKWEFAKNDKYEFLHPGKSAIIKAFGNDEVGIIGEVHPAISSANKLNAVYVLEINLSKLIKPEKTIKYKPFGAFPHSNRDISILVDEKYSYDDIKKAISKIKAAKEFLKDIQIFDMFKSDKFPANVRSIGLRFVIKSDEKTLKQDEIDTCFKAIIDGLTESLGATLR